MRKRITADRRNLVLDGSALLPTPDDSAPGQQFISPIIEVPGGFHRAVPSWNVGPQTGQGFIVELRVGRAEQWSPFLRAGCHGAVTAAERRISAAEFGRMEVDEFVAGDRSLDRVQIRVTFFGAGACVAEPVRRLAVAFDAPQPVADNPELFQRADRIVVPFRSQFEGTGELGPRLCSPACLAMVLAHHGIHRPTREVARACYDREHDLYGNWSRAVQAAFDAGLTGYVARFAGWSEVGSLLRRGLPIIAGIRFGEDGLPGAAIPKTAGHLVVVTGLAPPDLVLVSDPAFRDAADGVRAYPRHAFARAWFGGSGIGYVLGE